MRNERSTCRRENVSGKGANLHLDCDVNPPTRLAGQRFYSTQPKPCIFNPAAAVPRMARACRLPFAVPCRRPVRRFAGAARLRGPRELPMSSLVSGVGYRSRSNEKNRLGFQRMVRDAQEVGDFNAILCWDKARFSSWRAGSVATPTPSAWPRCTATSSAKTRPKGSPRLISS